LTGSEVGRIERVGVGDPDGFVVGRVELVAPHPSADRLSVCLVDDGSGTPRTIVCGAPNVAAGQTVAVALPGALMPNGEPLAEAHASVEIADPDICLRFTARVFEDVKVGPSPLWLKALLTAAGQRPISNVVDITNYVMLVCGQPLHAFDLDRVRGARIVVRKA